MLTPTSYEYTYDTAGNIRSAKKTTKKIVGLQFVTSVTERSYFYGNTSWPDLLTAVTVGSASKTITYPTDGNGNVTAGTPLTWYNGSSYNFTWKKGTQLASTTKGSVTTTYDYDMSGVRSRKTVHNTTYDFATLSGLVMRQTWGSQTLDFVYDDSSQPYALVYNNGSSTTLYYYMLNQQGYVMALMNTSSTFIGNLNPLRYRGYYYDTETGFYYLQSRYYDPAIGRFISADNYASTGHGFIGCNMFAYCGNNPVNYCDPSGNFFFTLLGAVIGGITGYIDAKVAGEDPIKGLKAGAAAGAISGAGVDIGVAVTALTGGTGIGYGVAIASFLGAVGGVVGVGISNDWKFNKGGEDIGYQYIGAAIAGGITNAISFGLSPINGEIVKGPIKEVAFMLCFEGMKNLSENVITGGMISACTTLMNRAFSSMSSKPSEPIIQIS